MSFKYMQHWDKGNVYEYTHIQKIDTNTHILKITHAKTQTNTHIQNNSINNNIHTKHIN